MKVYNTTDHEITTALVRRQYRTRDRLVLPEPTGGRHLWTVVSCERDPHGWKVTAVRCLESCRSRHRRGLMPAEIRP